VRHHLALSVVGTERLQDSGYFRAKFAQESLIKASPIPYTLIRATQFFEFLRALVQLSTEGDKVRLAPVLFQPIAADDVASAIADAALAEPLIGTVEIAGPDRFTLDETVRKVLEFDHDSRKVIADPDAPYSGARVSERTLIPDANAHLGSTHFEWWLTHVPPPPPGLAAAAPVAEAIR
jgi:uncharacterized protein YbjT (DUF2867 family)